MKACAKMNGFDLKAEQLAILNNIDDFTKPADYTLYNSNNVKLAVSKVLDVKAKLTAVVKVADVYESAEYIDSIKAEIIILENKINDSHVSKEDRLQAEIDLEDRKNKLDKAYETLGHNTLDMISAVAMAPVIGDYIAGLVNVAHTILSYGCAAIKAHNAKIKAALEFLESNGNTSEVKEDLEELEENGKKIFKANQRLEEIINSGLLDLTEEGKKIKEEYKSSSNPKKEGDSSYLKDYQELEDNIIALNAKITEVAIQEVIENEHKSLDIFTYSLYDGVKDADDTVDKASNARRVDPLVIDLNMDGLLESNPIRHIERRNNTRSVRYVCLSSFKAGSS